MKRLLFGVFFLQLVDINFQVVAYRGANEVGIFFYLARSDAENVTVRPIADRIQCHLTSHVLQFVFRMTIEPLELDEGAITKGASSANVRVNLSFNT